MLPYARIEKRVDLFHNRGSHPSQPRSFIAPASALPTLRVAPSAGSPRHRLLFSTREKRIVETSVIPPSTKNARWTP